MMDHAALKAEIVNDPEQLGYNDDDAFCAKLLTVTTRTVDRDSVTGGEIAASVVPSEMAADAAVRAYVTMLAAAGSLPLTDNLKAQLKTAFPQGTSSRANLLAILRTSGSRAQELGLGGVTPSDVAKARKLP